jgi:hypothetical protein
VIFAVGGEGKKSSPPAFVKKMLKGEALLSNPLMEGITDF